MRGEGRRGRVVDAQHLRAVGPTARRLRDAADDGLRGRGDLGRIYDALAEGGGSGLPTDPDLLVERLVTEIARLILTEYPISRVRVRLEKPGALRFAKSVGIEIDRRRADFGL